MSHLASIKNLSKGFGAKSLFSNLNLHFSEGERVAIIGKNGSGKSTLLKILAGQEKADAGEVVLKKGLDIVYVSQVSEFNTRHTILEYFTDIIKSLQKPEDESWVHLNALLTQGGFFDLEKSMKSLSGGEAKKLTLIEALLKEPQLLLLDEPTNHLDWDGILWLENQLRKTPSTFILVSHDRYFLNQVTKKTIEIGQAFENEHIQFNLPFDEFIKKKDDYFLTQERLLSSLSNKARREVEWLRAGVQARTTKSRSRQDKAYRLLDTLDMVKTRVRASKTQMQIEAQETARKTKKLVEFESVSMSFEDNKLFSEVNLLISPKKITGILGSNGSGKTTFLKLLMGLMAPVSGVVKRAENLQILYFDQRRESLDLEKSVFEYLGDGSDYVVFADQSLHVASYAQRFLFESRHFALKVAQLSGGEKARLALAKSLLSPCDILILDEPTNDLDIDSLESLEGFLSELNCAILIVSHDRTFLAELCDSYFGLLGDGKWGIFADFHQWIREFANPKISVKKNESIKASHEEPSKKPLSYKEKKDLEKMEDSIFEIEGLIEQANEELIHLTESGKHELLFEASKKIEDLQKKLEHTFEYWQLLESRK